MRLKNNPFLHHHIPSSEVRSESGPDHWSQIQASNSGFSGLRLRTFCTRSLRTRDKGLNYDQVSRNDL
jgi:hypothetical protein